MYIFQIRRKTLKTDVEIKINFIGNGFFKIKTFLFYFDYIFSQFIIYSLFDCYLRCYSDLKICFLKLIKDIAICLSIILKKKNNNNNINFILMDNNYLLMNIDFCNKNFYYDNFIESDYDIRLIREFFNSFSKKFKCFFYIYCFNYLNKHHLIKTIFKLFGIIFKYNKINYLKKKIF
ncbi:imidazoleglycerol-phosphate dehydratase [Candidatus Carsonella ruddii HT isolate Thao2000]|uniref:Imidazoleglycerol-phosphate dehydratase n=1 Tax=Candidatus Carsonella ruddii HT isolate Thao2000 TaxID=1202539 RepID=J3VQ88_CARRU|nr:imidazoleglycerol-phosphate dehydratase [Candidatus Carsonella ruddii]AFP84106.1 imidazoleglycerol-phosphate dehydratase [Candidatus Carsonella ruddii HT isolate Thao2000]